MDMSSLVPFAEIRGEGEEETHELREMAKKAREYISAFRWCPPIREIYLGIGIGGVLGTFLVEFTEPIKGVDERLWVVVGDLPSAYFVTDRAPDAESALRTYCDLMEDWAGKILGTRDPEEVYPVDAALTEANARALEWRTQFIRKHILMESPQ